MNKTIIILGLLLGTVSFVTAQVGPKNALGLRIGDNSGIGAEISYQRSLLYNKQLELDLGWRSKKDENAVKLVALCQWVWKIESNFYWYAGVGGGLCLWNVEKNLIKENGILALISGDLGIKYNFDFPIQLSLDLRPEFYLGSNLYRENNYGSDIAIGIRYRFR